jgi:MFS family permease
MRFLRASTSGLRPDAHHPITETAGVNHPPTDSPTRQRYLVMTFLCILSFLTYFDRICIARAQEDIKRDLNLTDTQMGLVFSAFWLAYALFELPGGWMGDRYGARRTLTRIVLARSLFTFRFLFGAGEARAYPNMARVQAN